MTFPVSEADPRTPLKRSSGDAIGRVSTAWLYFRAIPKTALFNLRYFGFRGLLHPPVLVSHRVKLSRLRGAVGIPPDLPRFSVRLGFGNVGLFDSSRSRSIWENFGTVCFEGKSDIGHGCKLSIGPDGVLSFGPGFAVTAESAIRCGHRISFGAGCLLSWDVLVMDQDFHPVYDAAGIRLNPDRPIHIGDRVWIGCRSVILKGAVIGDGSVVAAGSLVTGRFDSPALLLAGHPARIIRTDVSWRTPAQR